MAFLNKEAISSAYKLKTSKNKITAILLVLLLSAALLFSACSDTTVQAEPQENEPAAMIASPEQPAEPSVKKVLYEDGLAADGKIHAYCVGEGERVDTEDQSEFLVYVEYYPANEHLIAFMNGKEYVYANVSEDLWNGLRNAEYPGKYFNAHINRKEEFWIKDYDGDNGDLIVIERVDG